MGRGFITRQVERLDQIVGFVGRQIAWLEFALVGLVAGNVLGRYFFSAGTIYLQELEWHLMAVLALIGVSYGINRGEEVRVDMLYAHYRPRLKALVDALSSALLTAVALALAWLSYKYVTQSYALGEGSPDPGGLPHRFLLKAFLVIGFGLLAAQGIVETVKAVLRFGGATSSHQLGTQQPELDNANGK